MKEHDGEKMDIPPQLKQIIIRVQIEKKVGPWDACLEVARMAVYGSKEFDKAVDVKADKLAKSRYFDQLNRTRGKISEDSYKRGYDEGYAKGVRDTRQNEANFPVPCSVQGCPEIMHFSSLDSIWPVVAKVLGGAFSDWTCGKHTPLQEPGDREALRRKLAELDKDFLRYMDSQSP